MIPLWTMAVAVFIAGGALAMTLWNLAFYRRPDASGDGKADHPALAVTVCIPARNEAANIEACVRAVLADASPQLCVLVYDDQSDDDTPRILARLCEEDPRVRRVPTRPLPEGWVGKQWACQNLGETALAAAAARLVFIDADVRLAPGCLRAASSEASRLSASMISTFPRQITGTIAEALVVPLIHFILLSYLPFVRMRHSRDPASSAACGQFIMVSANAYRAIGGHSCCRDSMHDGVRMPRAVRKAGFHTDLFDGTGLASCRMYRGLGATWLGFAKNAYEGLGSPVLLAFLTLLHLWGHVLPWVVLAAAFLLPGMVPTSVAVLASLAVLINLSQRFVLAVRFQQSILSAVLHPFGILMMTLIQWHSYVLHLRGARAWRGRPLVSHREPAPGIISQ